MVGLVGLAVMAMPAAAVAQRPPGAGARIPGCTIVGTPRADVLVGGPGDDIICGLGGNDRLFGGGGDDVLRGGPGNDRLQGGSGDDVLRGDEGADELRGGSGDDEVYAGPGDDDAQGGAGNDTIWGGTGDDDLGGGPGRDTIRAVDGPDFRDVVGCGSGEHDRAFADTRDDVSENCEANSQNTAPHAIDDSYTGTEDTTLSLPASGTGSPAANDTDAEGDPLSVVAVSHPAGGTVSLSGGTITFTPTANLCGPAAGGFDYTVSDGHSTDAGRVTIALTCTPDDPTAADDLAMVAEDSGATSLSVLGNDHDPDGDPLVIDSVTQPANGTVVVTAGGSGLTYAPDPNYCNAPPGTSPDTFTYTLTPGGSTATVTVLVLCADDAPVAVNDSATVAQDASATSIDVLANDTDIDGGPKTIASASDPAHGTVVITGGGTGLTYAPDASYCNNPPGTTPDTFTYTLSPGASTATVSVTVTCANNPPVAASTSVSTAENVAKTITLSATDADGDDPLTLDVGSPAHGSLGAVGAVTCDHATPNTCTADVTYTPDAHYNGADSFTVTANDGVADSAPGTISITVTSVNDAPVLDGVEAGALAYTENDPATAVTSTATVTDIDSSNFDTGTLTVDFSAGGETADRLAIADQGTGAGQIGISGSDVTFGGTSIGTVTGGSGTTPLVVTFNSSATPAAVQALVRAVTYRNVSDNPSVAARTVRFVVTDGDGGSSAPATRAITMTAVPDAPVVAGMESGAVAYTENDPATAVTAGVTVADPDSPIVGATVSLSNLDTGDVLGFVNQAGITGSYNVGTGVLTLTGSATPAAYQTALRSITYASGSDNPSALARTVTFQVSDGTNSSNTVSRDITVTPVNDAPTDVGESQTAPGNTRVEVALGSGGTTNPVRSVVTGNLLDNAADVDSPHSALTVVTGTVSDPAHGSVSANADGSYVYTPDAGYTGADSFTYQVADGTDASTAHTVNLTVSSRVWYVRADAPGGGDGRSETPFNSLAAADTAANATGDTIYVFRQSGDSGTVTDASVDLLDGQKLVGSAVDLLDGSDLLYDGSLSLRPSLTGTSVNLAAGNTVRGLSLAATGTPAIVGGSGDSSGTLDQLVVSGNAGGLALSSTSGTFNVSDVAVSTTGGTAVALTNAGSVVFAPASPISITAAGGPGLVASGTGLGTSTFDTVSVSGSASGALSMTNTTGTTTFGDLSLTTTSGATGAFVLNNAGTVSVPGAGTATVDATGGPAVDVSGTTNPSLAFDSVTSTNSGGDGINLAGLGTGTFSAAAGSVTNAAGIDVDLDGGSGAVSYAGAISDDVGQLVRVQNTSGGTKAFTGAISDLAGAAGGGIALTNNGGATIRFDGGLNLSTGSSTAFSATGGGTVAVVDPLGVGTGVDNTLATTTGTALVVSGTTIHDDDLTFRSIASNGAADGIVLSGTTNPNGRLVVAGNGGACTGAGSCTGGAVQNSTGPGISLTDVPGGATLTRMAVTGGGDDGIRATTVSGGIKLDTSYLSGNGNAVTEDGLDYTDVQGVSSVLSSDILGSFGWNAVIANSSGTLNLTVTDSDINGAVTEDGLQVKANGTATIRSNITGNRLSGNKGDAIQVVTDGAAPASTSDHTITNNTISGSGATSTDGGITYSPDGSSRANISSNVITSTSVTAITINPNPVSAASAAFDAIVSNNTIGTPGVVDSGSVDGDGIDLKSASDGTTKVSITNNTVRNYDKNGIWLRASESTNGATTNVTATGNQISEPDPVNSWTGLELQSGSSSSDVITMCADVGGAGALANTFSGTLSPSGLGAFWLDLRFVNSVLKAPGYAGSTSSDRQAYFQARNTGFTTYTEDGTQNMQSSGACAQPTAPTLPTAP